VKKLGTSTSFPGFTQRNQVNGVDVPIFEGLVRIGFSCDDHIPQLQALAARYAARHPDLADLCLIRMSELSPEHSIITVDREDFRVYRRNKREMIPIICPPDD